METNRMSLANSPVQDQDEILAEQEVRAMLPLELRDAPQDVIEAYAYKRLNDAMTTVGNMIRHTRSTVYKIRREKERTDELVAEIKGRHQSAGQTKGA